MFSILEQCIPVSNDQCDMGWKLLMTLTNYNLPVVVSNAILKLV